MKKHLCTKQILLFGFFSILVFGTYAQGTPYCPCVVPGLPFRAPITIINPNGVILTDHQVLINVTYNTNMNPDFSDLQFRNSSCTDLSYWIESFTASTSATIWIKIPTIPISGTTIYMYYGNPSATSASNGTNTFVVFSGFENGTAEGVSVYEKFGWCGSDPSTTTSISSSNFNSGFNDQGNCNAYIKTGKPVSLTGNFICGVRVYSYYQDHTFAGTQLPTFYCGAASTVISHNQWVHTEINSDNPNGYISTSTTIGFCGCALCDCGSSSQLDYLYIRKRASSEVTSTIGLQENDSALSVNLSSTHGGCIGNDGTVTAVPSNGKPSFSYIWNNGQTNQTAIGLPTGTYAVTVTDANGCTSSSSISITVNQPSSTNNPQTICSGQSYSINSHNYTTSGTYRDTLISSSGCDSIIITQLTVNPALTINNPQSICNGQHYTINSHSYSTAGTYYDTLATITNCDSIIITTLSVFPNPSITESHTNAHCSLPNGTATATPTGGTSPYFYHWSEGQTTQVATGLAQGTYIVTVTDIHGCSQTQTTIINSIPVTTPTASATFYSISLGDNTQLNSSGGETYQWIPSTGLSCTNCANPIATPMSTTTYCVVVTDSNSCVDSACVIINVDITCGEVFVPTAFSPNEDNQNDLECVYGNCIQNLTFAIYDRWGEKVFETNDPKECWDGIYKGKPLNTGAYVYFMKYTLYNDTAEKIKKGKISLVR